jgi:hypothetical protein
MKLVHEVIGTREDVVRLAAQEAEETSGRVIATALYAAAIICAARAVWLLLALCVRICTSVWYYWTERRPIERAKKRE